MYNRFLQEDNLGRATQMTTWYNHESGRTTVKSDALTSVFANVGKKRVTYCNKTRRSRGRQPPNPVEHQQLTGTCTVGESKILGRINGRLRMVRIVTGESAAFISSAPTSLIGIPAIDSKALSVLVNAKAKMHEAEADIGLMLAEGRETLSMLLNPFSSLRKLLTRMVASRRGKGLKAITDTWLEYRYGVMPLLSDIDALRQLGQKQLNINSDINVKRSSLKVVTTPYSVSRFKGLQCGSSYAIGTRSVKQETIYRATSLYMCNLTTAANLGLDASSIPATLWELVPYSFVVDWFIDVGSWIKAITPHPGIVDMGNIVSATTIRTDETCIDMMCASPSPSSDFPASPHNSVHTCTSVGYRRGINNVLPSIPGINPSLLSFKRTLDAVALSFGACKRHISV